MRARVAWLVPALVVLLAVAAFALLVRRVEPRMAFFPSGGEDVTPRDAGVDYTAHTIATADGERLRAWHLPRDDARAQVVYFHGNGGNLSLWSDVLTALWQQRLEVFAIDYRGYGLSTGRPSEQGLYRDAEATIRYVREHLRKPAVPLVYWGRSLGTVVAAYAAGHTPADGVVLEAGFPSVRALLASNPVLWALSWFASYRFPTEEWMARVRQPTLVLHGDRDSVVPFRLGEQLYDAVPGPKTFVRIEGRDHNDPMPRVPHVYWTEVERFVASLSRTTASPPPSRRAQ